MNKKMKQVVFGMVLGACSVAANAMTPEQLKATETLAKSKACLACHGVDKKVVGPAFKDVAKKYEGREDRQTYLEGKIKAGGQGVWGPVPMPAQSVTPAEAKDLATWILQMK